MSEENEAGQTYTKQDVINQGLVAFGQGTNFMRVSSRACRVFVDTGGMLVDQRNMHEIWGEVAVQVLERVRTMGRVAVSFAIEDGRTFINDDEKGHSALNPFIVDKFSALVTKLSQLGMIIPRIPHYPLRWIFSDLWRMKFKRACPESL